MEISTDQIEFFDVAQEEHLLIGRMETVGERMDKYLFESVAMIKPDKFQNIPIVEGEGKMFTWTKAFKR